MTSRSFATGRHEEEASEFSGIGQGLLLPTVHLSLLQLKTLEKQNENSVNDCVEVIFGAGAIWGIRKEPFEVMDHSLISFCLPSSSPVRIQPVEQLEVIQAG